MLFNSLLLDTFTPLRLGNASVTHNTIDAPAEAGFRLQTNGNFQRYTGLTPSYISYTDQWVLDSFLGAISGGDYEMQLSNWAGDALWQGGLNEDQWYPLSSARSFYIAASVGNDFTSTATLTVREIARPNILVSATMTARADAALSGP